MASGRPKSNGAVPVGRVDIQIDRQSGDRDKKIKGQTEKNHDTLNMQLSRNRNPQGTSGSCVKWNKQHANTQTTNDQEPREPALMANKYVLLQSEVNFCDKTYRY